MLEQEAYDFNHKLFTMLEGIIDIPSSNSILLLGDLMLGRRISKIKLPNNLTYCIKDLDLNTVDLSEYSVNDSIPKQVMSEISQYSIIEYQGKYYYPLSITSDQYIFTSSITSESYIEGKRITIDYVSDLYVFSSFSNLSGDTSKIVNLSVYRLGDIVPTDIVEELIRFGYDVEHDVELENEKIINATLSLVEAHFSLEGENSYLIYAGPYKDEWNEISFHQITLTNDISEDPSSTIWEMTEVNNLGLATYQDDGSITLWLGRLNNIDFKSWDETKGITLKMNSSQSSNITLNLPPTSGTLANTSDIPDVSTMISTALSSYSTTSAMNNAIVNHHDSLKADISSLSSVATSGSYEDLVDVPLDLVNKQYVDQQDTNLQNQIITNNTNIEKITSIIDREVVPTTKVYMLQLFGTEQYIDPLTILPIPGRYYLKSDIETGGITDNEKLDICLKAWIKYKYGVDLPTDLEKCSVQGLALSDFDSTYINHMYNFWSAKSNSLISNYPLLCLYGCYTDDGYGTAFKMTQTGFGLITPREEDGNIYGLDNLGHASVYGWADLKNRVSIVEDSIGLINLMLDNINGEVI